MNKRVLLILIIVYYFIFGCEKKSYTVTVLYDRPPRTLDPHMRNEVVTISILSNIYEGLIDYTPDLRLKPCLARAWHRADSTTWIFYLREDVHFHNGKKMRAEDAVYSLYRTIRDRPTETANLTRIVDTIYSPNPYRIVIKTRFPYYAFLSELDRIYIIPENYKDFSCPIGTGPFKTIFVSDDSIVCENFEGYWGKKSPVSRGVFKFIPELEKRLKYFKNCENCIIYGVPLQIYDHLKDSVKFVIISGVATRYLQLNLRSYPFNNREFRRAISMAINREKINNDLYYGLAEPANQFIPKGVIGYCPDLPPLIYNLDSAQKLIKKTGRPKIHFYYGKPVEEIGAEIAQCLHAAGINVVRHPVEAAEFWNGVEKRKFDFFLISSLVTTLDGISGVLEYFFHTYNPEKGTGLMNRSGFSNIKVDSIIGYVSRIEDPDERLAKAREIQKILLDEMPVIPILWEPRIYALSANIEFSPRIDQTIRLAEVRFVK
ncbi:MAG: ABC transporter substrate-binding protein [candidate division WOR-3 bacterium]|nr:ABC transporter substrate-binding protein [candidate division WOR-3 bacterium]